MRTFEAPEIMIEKFEVCDVITGSNTTPDDEIP